jgi:hypothetical protein
MLNVEGATLGSFFIFFCASSCRCDLLFMVELFCGLSWLLLPDVWYLLLQFAARVITMLRNLGRPLELLL